MDNSSTNGNASTSNAAASTSTSAQNAATAAPNVDMVGVLGNLFKPHIGDERVAQILLQNVATLVQQGKLNQSQLLQV